MNHIKNVLLGALCDRHNAILKILALDPNALQKELQEIVDQINKIDPTVLAPQKSDDAEQQTITQKDIGTLHAEP